MLAVSQQQRLDDSSQWNAQDNIVMQFMYSIIPQVKEWAEESQRTKNCTSSPASQ